MDGRMVKCNSLTQHNVHCLFNYSNLHLGISILMEQIKTKGVVVCSAHLLQWKLTKTPKHFAFFSLDNGLQIWCVKALRQLSRESINEYSPPFQVVLWPAVGTPEEVREKRNTGTKEEQRQERDKSSTKNLDINLHICLSAHIYFSFISGGNRWSLTSQHEFSYLNKSSGVSPVDAHAWYIPFGMKNK